MSREIAMKRAGIIGLGTISAVHLKSLEALKETEICAVCDIDEEKRGCVNETVPFYSDYRELFWKEKPDCVHLCLPHYLHYPVSKAAVEAGIHVFCEKPAAVDWREAEAFRELEEENPDIHIGICLQNRKNETVEILKEIITDGEYGKLKGIRGFVPWMRDRKYYADGPWRGKWDTAGSGVLLNQAIHTLDLMYFLGGEIISLKAMAGQLLDYDLEVEDTVMARLDFQNGMPGLFMATNANFENESVSIRVHFEKGDFLLQDNKLFFLSIDGNREVLTEDKKMSGTKFYYGASHEKTIREFYQALEDGTQNYIHVKDACKSIQLVDAIFRSSMSSKTMSL